MKKVPKMNLSITKAVANDQVYDVVTMKEFYKNHQLYEGRSDVATFVKNKDTGNKLLLPIKKYVENPTLPGVYDAGCVTFTKMPDQAFEEKYIPKEVVTMNSVSDIKTLIEAGDKMKKLDEAIITSPDNITYIPIKEEDQPEMVALKSALNAKHIDLDTYAYRFKDNYPNDKRQLKSSSATLNIIKRYCQNCDMEAVLTLKDRTPDVPNPMNREISVSLTEPLDDSFYSNASINVNPDSED